MVTASSTTDEPFQVTVDANGLSNRSTPSIIGIENNRVLFGEEAENRIISVPHKMVHSLPSKFAAGVPVGPFAISDDAEVHLESSQLLSLFFKNYIGQVHPNADLQFVTVSVPVGFSDAEVQVVVDAARLAGLDGKLDVIDHMDSAMTMLCKDPSAKTAPCVVVIDCGFSQTSVGIMKRGTIVGKRSIPSGVADLITLIADRILVKRPDFMSTIKAKDEKFYFRFFKVCEKVLKDLSMLPSTVVDLGDYDESFAKHGVVIKGGWTVSVTRDQFENELLTSGSFVAQLRATLLDIGLTPGPFTRVEVVGGGSRVPIVAKTIADTCGVESVGRGLDGSAFAALGAALWSAGKREWDGCSRVRPSHVAADRDARLKEAASVQAAIEKLHALEVLKLQRKNDLEAYLYQIKYWLDDGKNSALLDKSKIEPKVEAAWTWFYSVDDGEETVSPDGAEYAAKLRSMKDFMITVGKKFFDNMEKEKVKAEKSLTANAEYLTANSAAASSAAEKRAKHATYNTQSPEYMTKDQSIKLAGKNRDEGNDLFKHGTVTDAMNRYMRAISIIAKINRNELTGDEKTLVDSIQLASNLNMAQCVVKMTTPGDNTLSQDERDGLLKRGIACADAALATDPANSKAKYRKAVCLDRMRETEQAKKVIDEAMKDDPFDADLKQLYDSLVATLKTQQSKAKQFFSKMFQ